MSVQETIKKVAQRKQEELAQPKHESRPLHELVVSAFFTVKNVCAASYAHSTTPESEIRIGGHSPSYDVGFSVRTLLEIIPETEDIPIKTLDFSGFSTGKAGDYVQVLIPRYKEVRPLIDLDRSFYLDRPFRETEKAIEIIFIGVDKKQLRTERAVEYAHFMR